MRDGFRPLHRAAKGGDPLQFTGGCKPDDARSVLGQRGSGRSDSSGVHGGEGGSVKDGQQPELSATVVLEGVPTKDTFVTVTYRCPSLGAVPQTRPTATMSKVH